MLTKKYKTINSLGDNNCAYNTAVLGIVDLILLDHLDLNLNAAAGKYKLFLRICNQQLQIEEEWTALKKYIEQNKHQPLNLQKSLAPVLRELVDQRVKEKSKQTDTTEMPDVPEEQIQAFQAEFRDIVFQNFRIKHNEKFKGGDIYNQHEKILEKFITHANNLATQLNVVKTFSWDILQEAKLNQDHKKELSEQQKETLKMFETLTDQQSAELVTWFKNEGYSIFCNGMSKSGAWGGDLEFKEIAEYFEIDFFASNENDKSYSIYSYNGSIPKTGFQEEIKLLIQRGIIDGNTSNGRLKFMAMDEQELTMLLDGVPNLSDIFDDFEKSEKSEKRPVANSILNSEQKIALLLKRNIIRLDQETHQYYYYSDLTLDSLLEKTKQLACKKVFIESWKKAYLTRPAIVVSNPNAMHWYYMQPTTMTHWDLSSFDVSNSTQTNEILTKALEDTNMFIRTYWNTHGKSFDSKKNFSIDFNISDFIIDGSTPFDSSSSLGVDTFDKDINYAELMSNNNTGGFFKRHSPPHSPPPKRVKYQSNDILIKAANNALAKLTELQIKNPIIEELITAYHTAATMGKINQDDCFLLCNPLAYASIIKGITLDENILPEEVNIFNSRFKCEILSLAQKQMATKFDEYNFFLVLRLKPNHGNQAASFISQINLLAKSSEFPDDQLKEYFRVFDPNTIDTLQPLLGLGTAAKLKEIKQSLSFCKDLIEMYAPSTCAATIVKAISEKNKPELQHFYEFFLSISQNGFGVFTNENLKELNDFNVSDLPQDYDLAIAISTFVKLFRLQLNQLSLYLPSTLN